MGTLEGREITIKDPYFEEESLKPDTEIKVEDHDIDHLMKEPEKIFEEISKDKKKYKKEKEKAVIYKVNLQENFIVSTQTKPKRIKFAVPSIEESMGTIEGQEISIRDAYF